MADLNEKQLPEIRIGTAGRANYIGFRPNIKEFSDPVADMLREVSPSVSDRLLIDNSGMQYRELGFRSDDKPAHHMGNVALGIIFGLDASREDVFSDSDVTDMSKGKRLF